ncbi:MAG TPA: hypothetical protein VGX25_22040 [Actinophytocola sp.]|uniref:hypothetical protein n=1 Tax=Actinophytocola sp. TaxID=1872138 RepID=UPI002DDC9175|nr:hypothetical protein [Actinophytocola sp.]HEV2782081.1 hypothetical protein [Actinophytocola sp.]
MDIDEERTRSLLHQAVFLIGFVALLVILAVLTITIRATAAFGVAMLVAMAAMVSGGLLGFLFGIPRSLQANRDPADTDSEPVSPNTNLEQISDWLTKILVGVGLVQLGTIGSAVGKLIGNVSTAFEPAPEAKVIAGSLLVLPSVGGFMIGYIGTRTWLFKLFTVFAPGFTSFVRHEVRRAVEPVRAEVQQVQQDQETLRELFAVLDDQLDPRAPEPEHASLKELLDNADSAQRDQAFQTAKRARRSALTDQPTIRRTIPVFQALVEVAPDRYVYQAELAAALADIGDYSAALAASDKAVELRGAPTRYDWFEFTRARARAGLIDAGATPDEETAKSLREDLAVAWHKPSFRAYVKRILDAHEENNPEYQELARLRAYLPSD